MCVLDRFEKLFGDSTFHFLRAYNSANKHVPSLPIGWLVIHGHPVSQSQIILSVKTENDRTSYQQQCSLSVSNLHEVIEGADKQTHNAFRVTLGFPMSMDGGDRQVTYPHVCLRSQKQIPSDFFGIQSTQSISIPNGFSNFGLKQLRKHILKFSPL